MSVPMNHCLVEFNRRLVSPDLFDEFQLPEKVVSLNV